MAKFKITDNVTGKTVTISGDHEPSQSEAEKIFTDAGLRQNQQQPQPSEKLSYQQGDNPLLYAAAKAQEFTAPAAKMFGETDVLPMAGAIAGRTLVPNAAGTGAGAMGGKFLQGLFQPGDADLKAIGKAGVEAAAWDLALTKVLPTIFRPGKALAALRDYLGKNKVVDEKVVYKIAEEMINKPGTVAKVDYPTAVKELENLKPTFHKIISAKDAFIQKSKDWAITKAGTQRAGATNELSSLIANAYREALKEAAPLAQKIDAPLAMVQRLPRQVQGIMRGASYAGQTLFGLEALRRAIGQ